MCIVNKLCKAMCSSIFHCFFEESDPCKPQKSSSCCEPLMSACCPSQQQSNCCR